MYYGLKTKKDEVYHIWETYVINFNPWKTTTRIIEFGANDELEIPYGQPLSGFNV